MIISLFDVVCLGVLPAGLTLLTDKSKSWKGTGKTLLKWIAIGGATRVTQMLASHYVGMWDLNDCSYANRYGERVRGELRDDQYHAAYLKQKDADGSVLLKDDFLRKIQETEAPFKKEYDACAADASGNACRHQVAAAYPVVQPQVADFEREVTQRLKADRRSKKFQFYGICASAAMLVDRVIRYFCPSGLFADSAEPEATELPDDSPQTGEKSSSVPDPQAQTDGTEPARGSMKAQEAASKSLRDLGILLIAVVVFLVALCICFYQKETQGEVPGARRCTVALVAELREVVIIQDPSRRPSDVFAI